jgi:NitT/TauT family transport system substrate-binding protein
MLRRHGLEDRRDYTMVEAPLPTMRAMLAERKVDLVPVVLPFAVDPELRRIARPLFYNRDVVGVTQLLMWVGRQPFIEKNRAAVVDFMEDTLRISRWYLDPANHGEAMAIAGRITRQPPDRFDWAFTKRDYYHDPDMRPNLDALQKNVAMMKALGFVTRDIDVKEHADVSLVQEAAKRLR